MGTVHIFVEGRVQMVGFRYYTLTQAQSIGINGWARNTYDGRVEIIAQGHDQELDTFITLVKKGPLYSQVDKVIIKELDDTTKYTSFDITY